MSCPAGLPTGYSLDESSGVWARPGDTGVTFSDNDANERYLLEQFRKARDKSLDSPELLTLIQNWPTEYHLSPLRRNLLAAFDFSRVRSVLEVGCGCGAITRQLGEAVPEVLALEGAPLRAAVTAERCRDLTGVRVYLENLDSFSLPHTVDVVTLIGVLEYSRLFMRTEDPVRDTLQRCFDALEPDGTLVIAIENQLGTKYLCGHAEDHLGIPYAGVSDLYSESSTVTFGPTELSALLQECGFASLEFLYPFPDYKMPLAVVHERAFQLAGFSVANLLGGIYSRSHGQTLSPRFDETLLRLVLERNGLLEPFCNSLLIVARRGMLPRLGTPTWLAENYSLHLGQSQNCRTTFSDSGTGLTVSKTLLSPAKVTAPPAQPANDFSHLTQHATCYEPGESYLFELKRILLRGGGVPEVVKWAKPWIALLRIAMTPSSGRLPPEYLDCTPYNLIRSATDGELRYIDREWSFGPGPSLQWVALRGLAYSLERSPAKGALLGRSYASVLLEALAALEIEFADGALEEVLNFERRFYEFANDAQIEVADLYLSKLLDGAVFVSEVHEPADQSAIILDVQKQVEQLSDQNSLMRGDITRISGENSELRSKVSEYEEMLRTTQRLVEERGMELARMSAEIDRTAATLQQILGSRGWRLAQFLQKTKRLVIGR